MFAIKVEHKGKVINLGKGITSLDKIHQEVRTRFPIDFKYGVKCIYAESVVKDFETISRVA